MRKAMGIMMLLALIVTLAAQTVTVTKPAVGETWVKGTAYAVTWTKSGTMPDLVRISLRDPNTLAELRLIQDNVSNTGTFPWTVPADIADGQYRIRVKVKDVAVQDDSDIFNVAAVAPAGTITVQDPGAPTVWHDGQIHEVKWWVTGNLPANYSVSLMDSTGTTVVEKLIASTVCCSIGTNHPTPFIPGLYRIRVRNIPTNVFGDSPVFTLSANSIIVTKPEYNSSWETSKTYDITWKKTGTQPNMVKISLYYSAGYQPHMVIALAAPNTGSYSWTVPNYLDVRQYRIEVIGEGIGLYNFGPVFNISFPKDTTSVVKFKK